MNIKISKHLQKIIEDERQNYPVLINVTLLIIKKNHCVFNLNDANDIVM
jgi:hypothetical protein